MTPDSIVLVLLSVQDRTRVQQLLLHCSWAVTVMTARSDAAWWFFDQEVGDSSHFRL